MGPGYSQFFRIFCFLMVICIFPLSITGTLLTIRNLKGSDCFTLDDVKDLEKEFSRAKRVKLEKNKPTETAERVLEHQMTSTLKKKGVLTKDDNTLRYFMAGYCYTKFWRKSQECKAYFNKGCDYQSGDEFTEICREIALNKFKQTFDGRVCIKDFFSQMTIANRANRVDTQEDPKYVILRPLLNYVTFFVILVMLVWKSHHNEMFNLKWDSNYTTVTDYSVLIKGLPKAEKIDKFEGVNVRKILSEKLEKEGYIVTKMSFVFNTRRFLNLKQDYIKEKTKVAKEEYQEIVIELNSPNEYKKLTTSGPLIKMKSQLAAYQERFSEEGDPKGLVGAVIVSFMRAEEAHRFLQEHKKRGRIFDFCGLGGRQRKPLEVTIPEKEITRNPLPGEEQAAKTLVPEVYSLFAEEPAEPSDVIWENQAYSNASIFWRKRVVHILSFFTFALGFLALMSLKLFFVRYFLFCQKVYFFLLFSFSQI